MVWHFLYAIAYAWLYTQATVRQKGHAVPWVNIRVMQISNQYPAKTQAEVQQTVQPVFNMEKGT